MANERCVHKRCALKPLDGQARCEVHSEHHRETQEARRLRFRANNLCGACGRPAVEGKARCEKHDSSLGVGKCGFCGGVGHNRTTCIERKQKNEVPKLHCKSCGQSVPAHESAIREKAAALVEAMEKLFNDEYGIIYGENDIKTELAALKAELETPTGKEQI